jgi:4-carboxymuconolactone decarboxylase
MARLPDPDLALDPDAQRIYDRLVSHRGVLEPHNIYLGLLNHPQLAEHVGALGTFLRFGGGALPDVLRELIILWVAKNLGAAYLWVKHEPVARKAGVPNVVLDSLRQGRQVPDMIPHQQAALAVAGCVLARRSIPPEVQEALSAAVGLPGVIELVVLTGFYQMFAGMVFAFDVPLPEGAAAPFG